MPPPANPLKNATFRQLSAFHAVARLGSVSKAAEEMHLTQPAVSIQLGILEDAAGTPLLKRSARGVKLTEAGELLAGYAARILGLWREAGEAMALHCGDIAGLLRIGAVTTAEYLLPPLLLEFVREHPQVKVKLSVGNRAEIVGLLAGQEIDLAIMGRPPAELKTVSAAFAKHPMAFVAAPTHPLMSGRRLGLDALADANLLVRERGSGTRTTVEQLFKDAGVALAIGTEMSSNEAIKQMCAAGFGIAFLSLHACVLELETGRLGLLPMAEHPVERDWYVMHIASKTQPAVAAAFEQFLRVHGQAWIHWRLEQMQAKAGTAEPTERKKSVRSAA
ncbi:MAG TPA: LysR family transcriptional regulator [Methylibium sp.]|uniref:LysR family transcriptional regulator n=1 Tax=Methylibium sp. TaxID=2067992 RepID=UPI002DBAB35F|nr:LysR family transcriptional regulator [Methylibium sp.]HEU4459269.1 LysR family transcriptional regulator [Methylibium sp.]